MYCLRASSTSIVFVLMFVRVIQLEGFIIDWRRSISKHDPDGEILDSVASGSYVRRNAVREKWRLWEEAVVPYAIAPTVTQNTRNQFFGAMKKWEAVTCLKFVPEEKDHKHSIYIESTGDCPCCSILGRFNRRQTFVLHESQCPESAIMHEIGHAIGFAHEQSRPDRDEYIKVLFENIEEGAESEYEKVSSDAVDSLGFGYDFQSIMHYLPSTFSKNGRATMESLNESFPLAQEIKGLSKIDIAQTKKLYNCPECYFSVLDSKGILEKSEISEKSMEGSDCEWFIQVKDGKRITFFIDYTPESDDCSSDYLQIRDGYWSKSPVIGRYCGNQTVQESYKSTSNSILINYKSSSNSSNTTTGFYLKYIENCGGRIEADEGKIESEQFQEYSSLTSKCQWIIVVPSGYVVAVKFDSLNMKNEENCTNEFVEIFEGEGENEESLGKFCGSALPDTIVSNNNTVTVKMISKKEISANDFSLSFVKELNECELPNKGGCSDICVNTIGSYYCECEEGKRLFPNKKFCGVYINECGGFYNITEQIVIASPNFPERYPKNSKCTWEIANENVHFTFIYFDTEKGKKKCKDKVVITGSNFSKKTFCGRKKPSSFNATDVQDLKIEFTSDRLVQKKGFAILLEAI